MAGLMAFGFTSKANVTDTPSDPSKKRNSGEPDSPASPVCPKKRKRIFQTEWSQGREWLVLSEVNKIVCTTCVSFDHTPGRTNNVYVTGSGNFRLSAIKDHECSSGHTRAVNAQRFSKRPEQAPLLVSLNHMSETEKIHLSRLFTTALFIALYNKPFTSFNELLHLQSMNFDIDLTRNYASDKQALTFIQYLSMAIREDVCRSLEESPFFSIMTDGSTDSGNIEEEIVYVRYLSLQSYLPETKFLAIKPIPKADAEHLKQAVINAIEEDGDFELWLQSLICCTADGAAVNFGIHRGLIAKLRDLIPEIIGLHCTAHRLELAVKQAMKQFPYMTVISDFLENVYKFYHNSPQNWAALQESGTLLNIQVRKPSKASGTRWVAHRERALLTVMHNWPALVEHLRQVKMADKGDRGCKAPGLYNILTAMQFVLHAVFLLKAFRIIVQLSLELQDNKATVPSVSNAVQHCQAKLCVMSAHEKITSFVNKNISEELSYKGNPLALTSQTRAGGNIGSTRVGIIHQVSEAGTKILTQLSECISQRVSEFSEHGTLINSFQIFDPANWPDSILTAAGYGVKNLEFLVEHFKRQLQNKGFDTDIDVCKDEFLQLITYGKRLCIADNSLVTSPSMLWSQSLRNKAHSRNTSFPGSTVLSLVVIMQVLPISSAEPERGFSHMKHIKCDWRASLRPQILSDLLTIKLSGTDLTNSRELVARAVKMWYNAAGKSGRRFVEPHGCHRRPRFPSSSSDSERDD